MNKKPYTDYTFEELLSELVYLGRLNVISMLRIEIVKDEIIKRVKLIEAHSGKI